MNAIFPGRIALDDGDAVDVSLTVEGAELRLATPAADIGSWPLVSCSLDELGPGRYRLSVDDDHVDFSPIDPDEFAAFLAGLSGRREPEGAEPASSSYPEPSGEPASPVFSERSGEPASPVFSERSGEPVLPVFPEQSGEPVLASSPEPELRPSLLVDAGPPLPDGGFAAVPDVDGPGDDEIAFEEPTVADAAVEEARRPARLPRAAVWIGAAALLVVAALVVALGGSGSSGTGPGPETALAEPADALEPAPPAEPAEAPGQALPEGTLPAEGPLFSVPAAAAVASWNGVAVPISPSLRVRAVPTPGPFAFPLSEAVTFAGTVGADGSLDELAIVVDGTSGVPAVGLQALGTAVAVVEPELDGPGLAGVLASLGFDVAAPVSDGLDAEVTRGAATYRLVAAAGVITLTITPL